jgi:threonine dehydrogenase-like Zn-dependent dehydrogenase
MQTVVELLATESVRVDGLPVRHFAFADAVDAYGWLDEHPNDAVKVALTYDGFNPGGER